MGHPPQQERRGEGEGGIKEENINRGREQSWGRIWEQSPSAVYHRSNGEINNILHGHVTSTCNFPRSSPGSALITGVDMQSRGGRRDVVQLV